MVVNKEFQTEFVNYIDSEELNVQVVNLDIEKHKITVLNCHIRSTLKQKGLEKLKRLISFLQDNKRTLLIAGDLNQNISRQNFWQLNDLRYDQHTGQTQ
jgi:hypothetical protein